MYRLSVIELSNQFSRGDLSATEIASFFLRRIEDYDGRVSAFLSVFAERILDKAGRLDEKRARGEKLGLLAAVPIALKDNIHLLGEKSTSGSRFLSNYIAPFSATVSDLIEKEDGLIIGKTNLDEFAMGSSTENSAYHPTYNPWNLDLSPGGSSGGSAAAVSARLVPIALGTDTGGSIRQPASFCGVVGFKPSYGRVSRYGVVAYASSFDQIGPLATNVEDIALMMEVIGVHCDKDSTSLSIQESSYLKPLSRSIRGSRVGIPRNFLKDLPASTQDHFDKNLKILEELGCSLVDIEMKLLNYSLAAYYILVTAEASTNLARFDAIRFGVQAKEAASWEEIVDISRQKGFGQEVKQRILLGTYLLSSGFQEAYYRQAQKVRSLIIGEFQNAFEQCDLIATPTSPSSAFPIGSIQKPLEMYLQDIFTVPANLAGLPAISIPSGLSSEGAPLGLHLMGALLKDQKVLNVAYHFEQATSFSKAIPTLFHG